MTRSRISKVYLSACLITALLIPEIGKAATWNETALQGTTQEPPVQQSTNAPALEAKPVSPPNISTPDVQQKTAQPTQEPAGTTIPLGTAAAPDTTPDGIAASTPS